MVTNLTVVTPTIDTAGYIDHAVASVPRTATIEHIIVHDGSQAYTDRLRKLYPWLRLMSGPGRGATPALAAAFAAASGEFVLHLNSDDRVAPGATLALARAAAARPEIDVWTGGTRIFETLEDGRERTLRTIDDPAATALTLSNVLDDLPLMTARFVRRSVFERVGPLDERFSACSDREFAIRMVLAGIRDAPLGARVSELRQHEGSQTIRRPGRTVPSYLREHVEIASALAADEGLDRGLRATFRDWGARETLRKLYYELRARDLAAARQTLREASARDALWLWHGRHVHRGWRLRRRSGPIDGGT